MLKLKIISFVAFFLISSLNGYSQTEDWKQYSSSMAGFQVRYPADWRAEEEGYYRVWHAIFISPGIRDDDVIMTSSIGICSQPKGYVSTSSNSRSRCSQRDDHLSESAKDSVVSDETVEIKGLKIRKKITEDKYRPTATYIYAFFSTKERDFLVSSYFSRRFNLDKYIPVFDQMLSSLQLLDEKTVLTFRNQRFDFAITYPVSWKSCPIAESVNPDEEVFLKLVPKASLCNGGNYISVSRMSKYSNEKNNRDLKEFLKGKIFSKTVPYLEFGNIHAAMGESVDENYIRRERYFYTNYPETYELLRISEMYDRTNENYQQDAKEILATARRFLKIQG